MSDKSMSETPTCPLCGFKPTEFRYDGGGPPKPLVAQECSSVICRLACDRWPAVQALKDRIAELEAEITKWRPWSPEEVDAALDDIECIPMSDKEIEAMVERITDPTYRPNEPQHVQLLKRATELKQALREQVESQRELALRLQRVWMRGYGMSAEEIEHHCGPDAVVSLAEQVEEIEAWEKIQERDKARKQAQPQAERADDGERDSEGLPVPADEPDDAEILVWEIDPHLQSRDYDTCLERSWHRMLSFVEENLDSYLERFDEVDLRQGVNVRFHLVRMAKREYLGVSLGGEG